MTITVQQIPVSEFVCISKRLEPILELVDSPSLSSSCIATSDAAAKKADASPEALQPILVFNLIYTCTEVAIVSIWKEL